MEKWQVVGLLLMGLFFMMISVLLRAKFGEKYDLRTLDLILIVLPLLFVLLVTGKMKVFDAFGIKADLSDLFASAAGATIEEQVAEKPTETVDEMVNMLEMAAKRGVQDIPRLVEKKTQAIEFRLGHGGYYGPAIRQYFDALYDSTYLQYLILQDSNGKLYGIYVAPDLAVSFRTGGEDAYNQFAQWLNQPDSHALKRLQALPGFIGKDKAVINTASKREVLQQMDNMRVESLPVVDKAGFFVGTVERSQLTASMILEVVGRLDAAPEK